MTQQEAAHILNLCKRHELPRPKRHHAGDDYELRWEAHVFTARARSFDAALHLCRYMFAERKGRAL